jgi:hypothetical protein
MCFMVAGYCGTLHVPCETLDCTVFQKVQWLIRRLFWALTENSSLYKKNIPPLLPVGCSFILKYFIDYLWYFIISSLYSAL